MENKGLFYGEPEHNAYWEKGLRPDGLSRQEVFNRTKAVLNGGVFQSTMDQIAPGNTSSEFDLLQIQAGLRYAIFMAQPQEEEDGFIVVSPRSESLTPELEQEFDDLWRTRQKLDQAGVRPFIPKVYALGAVEKGFSAFTMEYKPEHVELVIGVERSLFAGMGIVIPEFWTNTPRKKSDEFKTTQELLFKNFILSLGEKYTNSSSADLPEILNRELPNSSYFQRTRGIMSAMIGRLYAINQVTGCVPREFTITAGDFMIDPEADDYDPQLITLAGGMKDMHPSLFPLWLQTHTEEYISDKGGKSKTQDFYPFLPIFIKEGIEEGKKLLST